MKSRTQVALNKLKKSRYRHVTKLTAVSELQNAFEKLKALEDIHQTAYAEASIHAEAILSALDDYETAKEQIESINQDIYNAQEEATDILDMIDEQAADLGVDSQDIIPFYAELLDYIESDFVPRIMADHSTAEIENLPFDIR